MKLTNLIWVLALAGTLAACNSGPPITNEKPITPPPTGGSSGAGGISGDGACTTEENLAVYEALVYTDCDGVTHTGDDASSAIGSDCILGTTDPNLCPAGSVPPIPGCGTEAGMVLGCFPNCPQETIDTAAACVANCVQTATAEAAPPGLSDECVACTGETVACGAAFCTNVCISNSNSQACIDCRCLNNCIQEFDTCSGLPSDGDC
jgi:hypothetical protein